MRIVIAMAALALAACSQDAPSGPAAEPEAGAGAPATTTAGAVPRDAYVAASTTATSITGDLMVTDAGIHFSQSQDYFTEAPQVLPASTPYAAGGETLADALSVPPATQVELRHVSIQNVGEGASNGGLCGDAAVTYVALAAAPDTTGQALLRIAAFRGASPPGPQARANDLCGVFNYMPGAPEEAPTPQ
ncbi:MAG: hypothetical protein AB7J28_03280 [Hyphomonadaceae bacterium]